MGFSGSQIDCFHQAWKVSPFCDLYSLCNVSSIVSYAEKLFVFFQQVGHFVKWHVTAIKDVLSLNVQQSVVKQTADTLNTLSFSDAASL